MTRALVTALLMPLLAAAPAGAAVVPDKPSLEAKVSACETGADVSARAVEFTGSMPALAGTRRMQMRFTLLQRRGTKGPFRRVAVPGWSDWEKSDPWRPGFIFTKRVESLLAPAAYKAAVTFRWYDKRGKLQRATARTTPACVQPDPRPDLVLSAFTAAATGTDQALYTIGVIDSGQSPAGPFRIGLAVGADVLPTASVASLAPGETAEVSITGPRCAHGGDVQLRLDAGDAVDEADEANDLVTRPCPL